MSHGEDNQEPHREDPAPGAFGWFFEQLGWYSRKLILWPVADFFRTISRAGSTFRQSGLPLYLGATLAIVLIAGGIGALIYFEEKSAPDTALAARQQPVTVPVEQPAPDPEPATATAPTTATPAPEPDQLNGVVPEFGTRTGKADRKNRKAGKTGAGGKTGTGNKQGAKDVVRPAPEPPAGPLRVAHRFTSAFVAWETGKKSAERRMQVTASGRLMRELRAKPPRLPKSGKVPRAVVLNVVKKKRSDRQRKNREMSVSVALARAGNTSELRLTLSRLAGKGWRVTEVLG